VLGGTSFNGKMIIGSEASTMSFQIGAGTSSTTEMIDVVTTDLTKDGSITAVTDATSSYINSTATTGSIGTVIDNIDAALNRVNDERAKFGAVQSRFDSVISSLQVSVENQTSALSDPPAGWQRHDCAGQPAAAAGLVAAPLRLDHPTGLTGCLRAAFSFFSAKLRPIAPFTLVFES